MSRKPQLEDWEVALIRAMLVSGQFNKQTIVTYFSRPDRSINQGRISEIENQHERYLGIEAASAEELEKFLDDWQQMRFPSAPVIEKSPAHPDVLVQNFPLRGGAVPKIAVSETSTVEGKESFDWGSRNKYCKTLAGMANNKGGYILFGVKDGSFEVVGIPEDRMERFDLRKANEFISRNFNQSMELDKGSFVLGGKTIGVLYVEPSQHKPVICKTDNGDLKSGDIYFRYPGETRRIQASELEQLLKDRDKVAGQNLSKMLAKISANGTSNTAVINLQNGTVEGEKGTFVIDEALLESVKLVSQGHFREDVGSPALKLIGDVRPIAEGQIAIEQNVVDGITEMNLREAFLDNSLKVNNKAYIQAQTHLQPIWLPIYYFAVREGLNLDDLVKVIEASVTPYEIRRGKQVERVRKGDAPKGIFLPAGNEDVTEEILSGDNLDIPDADRARLFLLALKNLGPDDIELERIIDLTRQLHRRFGNTKNLMGCFRYLIAEIDLKWFRPMVVEKGEIVPIDVAPILDLGPEVVFH